MKKFIFIMPLMAVALLVSCGGSKPSKHGYLELWSKETHYYDGTKEDETTTKIKDKHFIEQNTVYYGSDGETIDGTSNSKITYNKHGDIDKINSTSYDDLGKKTETVDSTYEYDKNYLLNKITSVYKLMSHDDTDVSYHTYEYDKSKRLTHELLEAGDQGGELDKAYERFNTYDTKFNTPTSVREWNPEIYGKHWYIANNELDNKGYITKSIVTIEKNDTDSYYELYTYDEYHCVMLVEAYAKDSSNADVLIKSSNYNYHKHNPNKLESEVTILYDFGIENPTDVYDFEYTYDEYDRKTSYNETWCRFETKKIIVGNSYKWEYDQVIPA